MNLRARTLALVAVLALVACVVGCSPSNARSPQREPASLVSTPSAVASASATTEPSRSVPATGSVSASATVFAVIGDYGIGDANEGAVARLVASWRPAYILTTGDDYYAPAGGDGTAKYDNSTGAFYGVWLKDISTTGNRYPTGTATVNAFFPTLGNHDYSDPGDRADSYLAYFRLPGADFASTSGNERYYDFVQGPIHFFALNSCAEEPDGTNSSSRQAQWLQQALAASTSTWNVVYDHHPPYASDKMHGSSDNMRWPFAKWGADAVLSGHSHVYERSTRDGIPYVVNGLGGAARYEFSANPVEGSAVRYNSDWGAQKVTVGETALTFEFFDVHGRRIDSYTVAAK